MAEKIKVLVDTDILIKVYRGDNEKERQLSALGEAFVISSITAIELSMGIRNKKRMHALKTQLKSYDILELNDQISNMARTLALKYNVENSLFVADALIAATTLFYKLQLFTDNKKDYRFIEGLNFYEPNK